MGFFPNRETPSSGWLKVQGHLKWFAKWGTEQVELSLLHRVLELKDAFHSNYSLVATFLQLRSQKLFEHVLHLYVKLIFLFEFQLEQNLMNKFQVSPP